MWLLLGVVGCWGAGLPCEEWPTDSCIGSCICDICDPHSHCLSLSYSHRRSSRIVRGLMLPVTVISAFATLVAAYQTLHAGALAGFLPALPLVPIEPFQLTSFALVGDLRMRQCRRVIYAAVHDI